ncbi:MAG: cytosine permease [Chitinophagaceae bacterium]
MCHQPRRTWGTWNYAALWISMSLCIPTYTAGQFHDK